jgi:hypothetical protein
MERQGSLLSLHLSMQLLAVEDVVEEVPSRLQARVEVLHPSLGNCTSSRVAAGLPDWWLGSVPDKAGRLPSKASAWFSWLCVYLARVLFWLHGVLADLQDDGRQHVWCQHMTLVAGNLCAEAPADPVCHPCMSCMSSVMGTRYGRLLTARVIVGM